MQYVIRAGDTLSAIAAQYTIGGKSYAPAIAKYNNIPDPNVIRAGATIIIPDNWLTTYNPQSINPTGTIKPTMAVTAQEVISNPTTQRASTPPDTAPAPQTGIMGILSNPLVLMGLGTIALAFFLKKKKEDKNEEESEIVDDEDADFEPDEDGEKDDEDSTPGDEDAEIA